jgi:hypothetical protein
VLPPLAGYSAPSAEHTLLLPLSIASPVFSSILGVRAPAVVRRAARDQSVTRIAGGFVVAACAAGVAVQTGAGAPASGKPSLGATRAAGLDAHCLDTAAFVGGYLRWLWKRVQGLNKWVRLGNGATAYGFYG